jgi:hypothetical protein
MLRQGAHALLSNSFRVSRSHGRSNSANISAVFVGNASLVLAAHARHVHSTNVVLHLTRCKIASGALCVGYRLATHSCQCAQGVCARNKRPATTKIVLLNVLLCAIPLVLNFVGGGLLAWSGKPVGNSLESLLDTAINQAYGASPA